MEKEIFENGSLDREDSGSETTGKRETDSSENRSKRPRIRRVENQRNDSSERPYTPRYNSGQQESEDRRRSYNPNFDRNNQRKPYNPYRQDNNGESQPSEGGYRPRTNNYDNQEQRKPRYGNNNANRNYNSEGNRNYNTDGNRGNTSRNNNRPYNNDGNGNRNNNYRGNNRPYNNDGNRNYGERRNNNSRSNNNNRGFRTPKGGFDSEYQPKVYPTFAAETISEPIRLNKYIAMSGLCSRREADEYIKQGLISVNGQTVLELGVKIDPADEVRYNDILLKGEKKVYILMNKPKGFVTTVDDPNADRTVMDIVKNACQERIYPVGRLDKNSLGVLLITNDGELTTRLTHPSFEKKKIYQVALDKKINDDELQQLCDGVELEDGIIRADEVSLLGDSRTDIGIVVHSGRNRIVRRMFEHLGYQVQKLDRVYFAGLTKKGLRRGAWRYLTPKEVAMLKSGSYE